MRKRNQTMQAMVEKANKYLNGSESDCKEGREMLITFVSSLLMEARCYKGFNYTYWTTQGFIEWQNAGEPEGSKKNPFLYGPTGDQTRITFY